MTSRWTKLLTLACCAAGLLVIWSCSPQSRGALPGLRQAQIPMGVRDARGRKVSPRAMRAYKTSKVRAVEKQYIATHVGLSQLPGVVAVRPGYGVVYVYTSRPNAVPKEYEGVLVKALPPEFADGVSEEWVTPDRLPPPGAGD